MSKVDTTLGSPRAIISGAASGLGLAVCEEVVQRGGQVAMLDIDSDQGMACAHQLGQQARFFYCDVTGTKSVDDAFIQARDWIGDINLAVTCAGILGGQRVLGRDGLMPMESFEKVIDVNLNGTFRVCRKAADFMQHNNADADDQRGLIVTTASIAAFEGQIGQASYAASKGGVAGLTLPLAREFARVGIRVVTIAPGVFETPLFKDTPQELRQGLVGQTPFPHRLGRPAEFARMVLDVFFNTMINGCVLRIDGAMRMPAK